MIKVIALTVLSSLLLLSGCAGPNYACGVPGGIGCQPLRKVQKMAEDGVLKSRPAPDQRDPAYKDDEDDSDEGISTDAPFPTWKPELKTNGLVTVTPGAPLLIPPRTLRVWVERWPDEDGTLHDETFLYLRLDNGHWIVEES
ncbi:MAG: TraV family lipoprotein [Gammaproteobacteria bacterium]|nr:TraV family lipoprotein [Gammaproteobacteria bacterium]MDH5651254.1 TraV family lipoprotein [Gammaproteobacteria bacterium]